MKHIHKQKKKGQIDDWFDYLFTVFVLFFLFFFLVGIFGGNTKNIDEALNKDVSFIEDDKMILTILDSPVMYKNVSMTYKEAILLSENQVLVSQRQEGIDPLTESILDPIYGENKWAISLCYSGSWNTKSDCKIYVNFDVWRSGYRSKKSSNILNEGTVTFKDQKNRNISLWLRVLS